MSKWLFIGLGLATALGILAAGSCTQGEGDRCQRDEDCESGFVCCKTVAMPEPTTDGVCRPEGTTCSSTPDASGETSREDATAETETTPEAEATEEAEAETVEEAVEETVDEADADETVDAPDEVPDVDDALPETDA